HGTRARVAREPGSSAARAPCCPTRSGSTGCSAATPGCASRLGRARGTSGHGTGWRACWTPKGTPSRCRRAPPRARAGSRRRRADYANRTYSRAGIGKGMFSDMGRTYVRYGAPSETYHQVIPTGNETIAELVNQLAATETRAVGDVTEKALGGDLRPFELWI